MLMIFFFVMPATVSGFGNLLLPVLASVPEMVFPKINNVGQYNRILYWSALCCEKRVPKWDPFI